MTEFEERIIKLLKKGCTYSEIQFELQVSSKTIAAVKKEYLSALESNSRTLSNDTFRTLSELDESTSQDKKESNRLLQTVKRTLQMNSADDYLEYDQSKGKLEIEKYRLQLAHELELEKIQAARDEKDREYDLKEKELEIRKLELNRASRKIEEEQRSLLFRIKKLVEVCIDGEYSYEEADEMLNEARKVLSESEQFCHIHNVSFQNTTSYTFLQKLIEILISFLEDLDEDDSEELEFDSSFTRQVSRLSFTSF